ncbi:MAG TPA: EamA family transporter [Oleiagrimonas sp.]|nr:EamA family transporter [Oleiagrimonas sp.]
MSDQSSPRRGAWVALAVMVLVWAYSWVIMKQVMDYAGPFDFAALRYGGGAVVLLAVLAIRRESLRPTPLKLTIAVGLCQTTAFQALSQWALVGGGAGHVSMLAYTMPFWVVLLAWWMFKEKPTPRHWAGLALAAVGLVCVLEPWHGLGSLHSSLLAIAGGLAWAFGTVLSKRMFQVYAPSPLSFTAWQMVFGSVALGVIALIVPSRPIAWTPAFIYGLTYSVLLASSLAWLLWLFVVRSLPTTVAGLSSLAVPVMAVLLGAVILKQYPDPFETTGIVLIVLGLLAVSGIGRRARRAVA